MEDADSPSPPESFALRNFTALLVAVLLLVFAVMVVWRLIGGPAYIEARQVCSRYDDADFVTDTCRVSWWDRTISVTMNADAEQIKRYCEKSNDLWSFTLANGWALQISTPYAAGGPVARCRFRSSAVFD